MKRYCGCNSPDERRKLPCEDEERNSEKKVLLIFKLLYFLCCEVPVERRAVAFSADDRLEQPSGTKRTAEERPLVCPSCLLISYLVLGIYSPSSTRKH
jgi:hypothetical protein